MNNILERVDCSKVQRISQSRCFQNFYLRKCFNQWKLMIERADYEEKRKALYESLFTFKNKVFSESHRQVFSNLNSI